MTTLMRNTLYYVVIAMQLQIIISFNTIAHTNPPHNIISYTLNNEDSNTNYKYNDTLNNDNSNKSFLINWHLWDSSQPFSPKFLYVMDYVSQSRIMYMHLPLEKFTSYLKLSHVKYGEVLEIKVTKGKEHYVRIYNSFDKTFQKNIKPLIFNWDININHKGIKIFKQKYFYNNAQKRRFISTKSLLQLLGYNIIPHWIDFVILKSIKIKDYPRFYLLRIVQAKFKVGGSGNEGYNCKFWLQYSTIYKFSIKVNVVKNAIWKLRLGLPLDNKQEKTIILEFKNNILYVLREFKLSFDKIENIRNGNIEFLINIWIFNFYVTVQIKKLTDLLQGRNSTHKLNNFDNDDTSST